jgi:hypothetical protein
MFGRVWNYVSNNALLAGLLVGAIVAAMAALKWSDVHPYVAGAEDWLTVTRPIARWTAFTSLGLAFLLGLSLPRSSRLRNPLAAPLLSPVGDLASDLRRSYSDYNKLETHLAEQERYLKSIVGTWVCWTGRVDSISSFRDSVTLRIEPENGGFLQRAHIDYPLSFREQVYERRKGDRVQITGTISDAGAMGPEMKGESLKVLV